MTCYFRHKQMKDVFERAGVVITKENRKEVDRVIHSIVGVEYKRCPDTWRALNSFRVPFFLLEYLICDM